MAKKTAREMVQREFDRNLEDVEAFGNTIAGYGSTSGVKEVNFMRDKALKADAKLEKMTKVSKKDEIKDMIKKTAKVKPFKPKAKSKAIKASTMMSDKGNKK